MHTNRIPLRRRLAGVVVAGLLVLTGGLMLTASASATVGQDVCPSTTFNPFTGGWVKYDGLHGTTYTYPQIPGFDATQICYKAATEVRYPAVSATITSTVTNRWGHVQDLSHASVYYTPRPPKPADHVTTESYTVQPSCETPSILVGDVTTTVTHVWSNGAWVHSSPVVVDNRTLVSLTAEELALCNAGPQPDPEEDVQAYTGEPSCETPTVLVGQVVTTTPYVLDVEAGQWVLGEPVVDDQRTELSLTEAEMLACQIPEKPESVVEVVAYTGQPTCAAPTVLLGDVTTTTGWVLDTESNTWVPGEPVVDDQRVQVSLTAAELAACVPTQPTQPTLPTAPTAPLAMAQTGSPTLAPALTALGMVLMGATALVARRRLHA